MLAYTAEKIFTGTDWLYNKAILVEDDVITDIVDRSSIAEAETINYNDAWIAPAFIDNQIYGAAGKLLAVYPTADSIFKLYEYCVQGGAHHFLPTVATNATDVFYKCIDAVRDYWKQGGKGVPGLHIEGPWLNKTKRGAHIEAYIHAPEVEEVRQLLEYGKDAIKMITLAPEVCNTEVIELIRSYDVIISAGHTNATYDEATQAFDEGIEVATHLFNAMSALQHREPGMVGAILNHPTAMSSIVPDGYHVNFPVISLAKKLMGERLFIITDAVTETNEGPYPHQLDGDKYVSKGILSGSALTMAKGLKNLVDKVGIPLDEALRMASLYPAKVIKMDHQLGRIEEGYKASFVVLDDDLNVVH